MTATTFVSSAQHERRILERIQAGDPSRAVGLILQAYGAQLRRYLSSLHSDTDELHEVYSQGCEDLLRSFEHFRGECSFRTWAFAVVRTASKRHIAQKLRRPAQIPLSGISEPALYVRSATPAYRQSGWKVRFRNLRALLPSEDRELLALRLEHQLSWSEIALVLSSTHKARSTSAALRKRFERIKAALKERAEQEGWLDELRSGMKSPGD